ncbi:hypothetical protein ACVWZ4_002490 [Bradyrhizobium sp. USDA 4472]
MADELKRYLPTEADWRFDSIRSRCPARAERLEQAAHFDCLARDMRDALGVAILNDVFRLAIDEPRTGEPGIRAIFQFPVHTHLFDAFFNSRQSYRANYWADPALGMDAERALILQFGALLGRLPPQLRARKIKLLVGATRMEEDVGSCIVDTAFLVASLTSSFAKLWICERPIRSKEGLLTDWVQTFQDEALRLNVSRWKNARAILPEPQLCWIDWKGAFVDGDRYSQLKLPQVRAACLHKIGWT